MSAVGTLDSHIGRLLLHDVKDEHIEADGSGGGGGWSQVPEISHVLSISHRLKSSNSHVDTLNDRIDINLSSPS